MFPCMHVCDSQLHISDIMIFVFDVDTLVYLCIGTPYVYCMLSSLRKRYNCETEKNKFEYYAINGRNIDYMRGYQLVDYDLFDHRIDRNLQGRNELDR